MQFPYECMYIYIYNLIYIYIYTYHIYNMYNSLPCLNRSQARAQLAVMQTAGHLQNVRKKTWRDRWKWTTYRWFFLWKKVISHGDGTIYERLPCTLNVSPYWIPRSPLKQCNVGKANLKSAPTVENHPLGLGMSPTLRPKFPEGTAPFKRLQSYGKSPSFNGQSMN